MHLATVLSEELELCRDEFHRCEIFQHQSSIWGGKVERNIKYCLNLQKFVLDIKSFNTFDKCKVVEQLDCFTFSYFIVVISVIILAFLVLDCCNDLII